MIGGSTRRVRASHDGRHLSAVIWRPLRVACLIAALSSGARAASDEPSIHVALDPARNAAEIRASIEIPVPPAIVWRVMIDCARAYKIISGLVSCRILEASADGASDVREHVIDPGFFLPHFRNRFRSDYLPRRLIRFHRIGGDLKIADGEWRLEPRAGGQATRLVYHAHLGLFAPLPGVLVRAGIRHDFPTVLRALRREALNEVGRDE